jgi:hypothetical protein
MRKSGMNWWAARELYITSLFVVHARQTDYKHGGGVVILLCGLFSITWGSAKAEFRCGMLSALEKGPEPGGAEAPNGFRLQFRSDQVPGHDTVKPPTESGYHCRKLTTDLPDALCPRCKPIDTLHVA